MAERTPPNPRNDVRDDETPRSGEGTTTDQLRDDIDQGRAGDKVGYPDPASAPLGTDAEAGGTSPTRAEVAQADARETARPDSAKADQGRPVSTPRGGGHSNRLGLVAGAVALIAVIAVIGLVI